MISIRVSDKAVGVVFLLDCVDRVFGFVSSLKATSDSFFTSDGFGESYSKKSRVMSAQDADLIISYSQLILKEIAKINGSQMLLMLVNEISEDEKKTGTDNLVIEIVNKLSDMHVSITKLIGAIRSLGSIVIKYKDFSISEITELSEILRTRFIALKKQINLQYKSDLFEVDVAGFMGESRELSVVNNFIDISNKERALKTNGEGDRVIICNKIHDNGTVSFIVKGEESVKFFTQVASKEFLSVREISCFDADDVDFGYRRTPLKKDFLDSFTHILVAIPILMVSAD